MTVRNFAAKTQDNYIGAVAKLAKFLGRSPDTDDPVARCACPPPPLPSEADIIIIIIIIGSVCGSASRRPASRLYFCFVRCRIGRPFDG